jgi:adenosylmethionine-8-amino-7-oxononanoate aminotransferase
MSVCDPVTGMHSLFSGILTQHLFAPRPSPAYREAWDDRHVAELEKLMAARAGELAAMILEPIVQGAGGMWFYHPTYLRRVRELCDRYDVLLILDEIATGFGRSGKFWGCEHAGIAPDVMCIGKAMTGGYMTLAATLTTDRVAETISSNARAREFMHGPTYMANALACSVALASVSLVIENDWRSHVERLERALSKGLEPCRNSERVADVRVLGAIGVLELKEPVEMAHAQKFFVERGVWIRPFGKLVYVMPPYVMSDADVATVTDAMRAYVER